MEFDKIIKSKFRDIDMEYGFVLGNEIIFLIKVGQDAILKGYNDKYIKIAKSINDKYGFTVICSSNHFTGPDPLGNAIDVINDYRSEMNYEEAPIYYMGYSNGGLIGAWYLHKHPEITNAMLINAPINTSLKTYISGIVNFSSEELILVYGDRDYSYKYIPYITPFLTDKVHVEIESDADHLFKGKDEVFQELPEKYLFKHIEKKEKGRT